MMSARVIRALGTVRAYVEYTMERAGPEPYVIHCSQAAAAVVHGAAGAFVGRPIDDESSIVAANRKVGFIRARVSEATSGSIREPGTVSTCVNQHKFGRASRQCSWGTRLGTGSA